EIRLEITLSEEILTGTKHNKSIPSPFCNKGWLLLLTLKAIQFPNHQVMKRDKKAPVDKSNSNVRYC
ncbi:MAG TPA: hypothetical protein ACHBZ9_09380, partial [Arsenophonus nasoniae]|uniref:hypothetical protein n=1 Tax=Arsenophonus nasoniae TaxID=638 RepID=UPI00387A455F